MRRGLMHLDTIACSGGYTQQHTASLSPNQAWAEASVGRGNLAGRVLRVLSAVGVQDGDTLEVGWQGTHEGRRCEQVLLLVWLG